MTLIRWNALAPGRSTAGVGEELERLFEDFVGRGVFRGAGAETLPSVDVEETGMEFVVRADLPGVDRQDIGVSLIGDTLTIRGERKQEGAVDSHNYHRVERRYGAFERSFRLGVAVRSEGAKARYKDGVLEIRVPKAEEAKVRNVEIEVSS